jgi:hypothetical protein
MNVKIGHDLCSHPLCFRDGASLWRFGIPVQVIFNSETPAPGIIVKCVARVREPGRETQPRPPYCAEVEISWSYTPTPPCVLKPWRLSA